MRTIRRIFGPALLTAGVIALVLTTARAQAPQQRISGNAVRAPGGQGNEKPGITSQQIERLEARIATATAIVNRLEREAKARGLASGWRQATLETLLPLSLEGLSQVEQQAFTLDALANATNTAADDPTLLGDPDKDLVYTPITPCRFIDTRNAAGKITGVRGFDVDLTGATYGGDGACNPTGVFGVNDAVNIGALSMNVTLVDTSTAAPPGFVAVKPNAAAPTTSLLNWYDQGPTVQVANQGIVSLDQLTGSANEFVIQTSGAVHIIVDLFGAFIRPGASALQTFHVFDSGIISPSTVGNIQSPVCPNGYTLTGGGCFTGGGDHSILTSYPGGGDVRWACVSFNQGPFGSVLFARAICARTPGR